MLYERQPQVPRISGRSRRGTVLHGDAMKAMKNLIIGLVRRDRDVEMLEYALITGLIVVTAVAMISSVGQKFVLRWQQATGW